MTAEAAAPAAGALCALASPRRGATVAVHSGGEIRLLAPNCLHSVCILKSANKKMHGHGVILVTTGRIFELEIFVAATAA